MDDNTSPTDANAMAPAWAAEWAAHFLTAALGFLVVGLIASICNSTISVDRERVAELLPSLTVEPEFVAPEPAERTAYFGSLVCVPVFMLLVQPIVRANVARLSTGTIWQWFLASCIAMLLLIVWGTLGDGGFYWSRSLASASPFGFLLTTVAGVTLTQCSLGERWLAAHDRRLRIVSDFGLGMAVVGFLAVTSILRVFTANDPYVVHHHFEAVFFTSTQVALGATLLIDLPHQYGLYPEFLAPVFNLLGGITVLRFTVVMAFLQAVACGLWVAALVRVMRSRSMAVLTFVGAFSLVSFLTPLHVIRLNINFFYDPYFQYCPIRSLFPAISLFAMTWVTEQDRFAKKISRCTPSAILGAGVLWNADAGVPALGAWIMCLGHLTMVRRRGDTQSIGAAIQAAVAVAVEALLCAAATVATCLTALAWKGGAVPDFEMMWRHQKLFYELGYMMLPMGLMHSWVAWAAVIMAAMSFGIWAMSAPEGAARQPIRSTLFGWAVLACGLFSYYQGRSHDGVFPVVLPIALALVGVAIARVTLPTAVDPQISRWWRIPTAALTTAFVVVMASGAAGSWTDPLLWKLVLSRWHGLTSAEARAHEPDAIGFAKQRLEPGDSALILSNHAGVYHAATRTRSQLPTSLIELMLRSDRDDLLRTIAGAGRVFVDRSVLVIQTPQTNYETNLLLTTMLSRDFQKAGESTDGYLLELKPHRPAEAGESVPEE